MLPRAPLSTTLGPLLDGSGNPRVGASATVKKRASGATVTVYSTETGAGTLANPGAITSNASGAFPGYVERNDLVATLSGGGLPAPTDVEFEANPGKRDAAYRFLASGTATSITPAATMIALGLQTESSDPDNVFSPGAGGTGHFIAPLAGMYHFTLILGQSGLIAATQRDVDLMVAPGGVGGAGVPIFRFPVDTNEASIEAPVLNLAADLVLATNDWVYPRVSLSNVTGPPNSTVLRFSGYWIGA